MASSVSEQLTRPKPIPLFSFSPESGRDTYREDVSGKVFEYWKHAQNEVDPNHFRLPRLVVRDHTGRKIDIYTSYQEKIYAARRNVRLTGEARSPEEWRLPHAPVPARPDLTRKAPPTCTYIKRDNPKQTAIESPMFRQQPFTVDVEDVSFVAESLRCLPDVASLSYLRHEFLAGNKLFLPILKSCMLHQRLLSALDRRVQQYQTPTLCTGCIRSGLCYGCHKGTQPHYHMDKMAKTGGGFTYYKRDRPGILMDKKDPRNWKTRFQEEFDKLAREIAAAGGFGEAEKGDTTKLLSLIPDFSAQYPLAGDLAQASDKAECENMPGGEVLVETNNCAISSLKPDCLTMVKSSITRDDSGMEDNSFEAEIKEIDSFQKNIPGDIEPNILSYRGWQSDEETEDVSRGYNLDTQNERNLENEITIGNIQNQPEFDLSGLDGFKMSVPANKGARRESLKQTQGTDVDDTKSNGKSSSTLYSRQQHRRERLYKAPPAFKLKTREKTGITSKSPFSENRDLNIPSGEGFTIKKSDKKLTRFKEFGKDGKSWKEPTKFELKENERKSTTFWSPPVKNETEKPRRKLRKQPQVEKQLSPEDPVLSSDSGLESEQFQAWVRQIIIASEQECQIEAEYGELFEYPTRWLQAICQHGYWPPSAYEIEELGEGEQLLSQDLEDDEDTSPEFDQQISTHSSGSVFEQFVTIDSQMFITDSQGFEEKNGMRKDSLKSNFTDSTNSEGAPPFYEPSRNSLTSPEFNLSLAEIQEELLPLTFIDPIEIDDISTAMKKLRRRRKKKSKKEVAISDDTVETPVGLIEGHGDNEEASESLLQITAGDFSPYLRSSGKYRNTISRTSMEPELEDRSRVESNKFKAILSPEANINEDKTHSVNKTYNNNEHDILIRVISDDKSSADSLDVFEEEESVTPEEEKKSAVKEAVKKERCHSGNPVTNFEESEHEKIDEKTVVERGQSSDRPKRIIKSPERIFSGLDDELMKKLPSIQSQLQKLGVNLNTLNLGAGFDSGNQGKAEDNKGLPIGPNSRSNSRNSSNLISIGGRPTSSRVKTPKEQTSPSVSAKDAGKFLSKMMHSDTLAEKCSLCGASLDNMALHICLPPISSRLKPKKTKNPYPQRVAQNKRTQKRIPVKEVNADAPSIPKESLDKGDDLHVREDVLKGDDYNQKQSLPESPPTLIETEDTVVSMEKDVTPPPEPTPKPKKERLQRRKKNDNVKKTPQKLPEIKSSLPNAEEVTAAESLTPPTPRAEFTPLPPITSIEIPELPDFVFPRSPNPRTPKPKTMIASPQPPPVNESKKIRKPPPKPRKQIKIKHAKRSVAEAPVTKEELQQATDPLDFLAKYCIIHVNRLPLYQHVFNKAVSEQNPRYSHDTFLPGTDADIITPRDITLIPPSQRDTLLSDGSPRNWNPQFSPHEMKMLHDLTVINRTPDVFSVGANHAEEYLEKLKFSFENLHDKQKHLQKQIKELQDRRVTLLAEKVKEMFPEILKPGGASKKKKKAKKSGKKSAQSAVSKEVIFSESSSPVDDKSPRKSADSVKPEEMSDAALVESLSNKMYDAVSSTPEVIKTEVELERSEEKLHNVIGRLEELQGETALMKVYCMEYFFQSELQMTKPRDFIRQQSTLYNSLHPTLDMEINLSEVGPALQTINNNLLTDKEMAYLFHVLNLAGRTRINLQLFSVLAALSERVAQLDPLIKKLINKLNYEALDVKMEKCKELFALLHEGDYFPGGQASASTLAVELTAGGLTPEHTAYVLSKFNRDGSGIVDFMDFVTYVPLFIEIHQRIVDDPLRVDLDL